MFMKMILETVRFSRESSTLRGHSGACPSTAISSTAGPIAGPSSARLPATRPSAEDPSGPTQKVRRL